MRSVLSTLEKLEPQLLGEGVRRNKERRNGTEGGGTMGADVSTSHRISQVICYRDTKETESEGEKEEKRRKNTLTKQKE